MRVDVDAITLFRGDWRDHRSALLASTPAAGLYDPPYGIAYQSGYSLNGVEQDTIVNDEDVSARDESIVTFAHLPLLIFGTRRRPLPPEHRMTLVWDKGPALGMGDLRLPWKPSHEEIYVCGNAAGFVGRRDKGSVIYHPPVQSLGRNGRVHRNQKPVGLLLKLMMALPAGRIVDPFMGSGSTAVACVESGRPFVGCEIVGRHFDDAVDRVRQAARQGRML